MRQWDGSRTRSHLHKTSLKWRHKDRGRKEMPIDLLQPTLFSRLVLNIHKIMICGLLPTPPSLRRRRVAHNHVSLNPIHFLFRLVFIYGSSRYLLMIKPVRAWIMHRWRTIFLDHYCADLIAVYENILGYTVLTFFRLEKSKSKKIGTKYFD